MTTKNQSVGSALLLAVMVMAVITTSTLGAIALRFDQLTSTDRLNNSAVAKTAADSALARLKTKLGNNQAITPTVFDLENAADNGSAFDPTAYQPNPNKIVASYQKAETTLPRCLGVTVLAPWVNDNRYIYDSNQDGNPALIFYYANIVNDTPLGIIPGNGGLSSSDKSQQISSLTKMGHFFNPYAPINARPSDANYWTVKLGGTSDEFLTKKAADGINSYYRGLDFIYAPYLPRFTDIGFRAYTPQGGGSVQRLSAANYQKKFEDMITANNFKVWIDASVSDDDLYKYGLGNLFTSDSQYRIKWLQPTLWNDLPESELQAPYVTTALSADQVTWTKKDVPIFSTADSGYNARIIKGSQPMAVLRGSTGNFSDGTEMTANLYGPMEGLRMGQYVTLTGFNSSGQPVILSGRTEGEQGKYYNVRITGISPPTISNGVESISIKFKMFDDASTGLNNTPTNTEDPATYYHWGTGIKDIDSAVITATPQFSTTKSLANLSITSGGKIINVTSGSDSCTPTNQMTACPAVSDVISLKKGSGAPVWGIVDSVTYNSSDNTKLVRFTVDKLRQYPWPARDFATTTFSDAGVTKLAVYGGNVAANEYDGGYFSESDELWLYNPTDNSWTYISLSGQPRLAGASMVYDSVGQRFIVFGGYYHEAVNKTNQVYTELNQGTIFWTNRPGLRMAKRISNSVWLLPRAGGAATLQTYNLADDHLLLNGTSYRMEILSTLADRSGGDGWQRQARYTISGGINLKVDGSETDITITPSAAGFSVGDDIYLSGNRSDGGGFEAWGNITNMIYDSSPGSKITVVIHGYKPSNNETQVNLTYISLQILGRQAVSRSCQGGILGNKYYYCNFNNPNLVTGYGVGDAVALEQCDQLDCTGNAVVNTLYGYISSIDKINGKVYLVDSETITDLADFTAPANSGPTLLNHSPQALPWARYGASLIPYPTDVNRAELWQGAMLGQTQYYKPTGVWELNLTTLAWTFRSQSTSEPSGSYTVKVIKPSYTSQVYTSTTSNPPIVRDLNSNGKTIWDNIKTWTVTLNTSGDQANATGKVVLNASVVIERSGPGGRESFHGIINSTLNTGNTVVLRHDSGYQDDSGLQGNSNSAKISISSTYSVDENIASNADWDGSSHALRIPTSNSKASLPLGAIVNFWNGTAGYSMIVTDRTYDDSNHVYRLLGNYFAGPNISVYSSNQIGVAGTDIKLISLSDYQDNYSQPLEWVTTVSGAGNVTWSLRASNASSDFTPNSKPSGKKGAALGSYYDSANLKTDFYTVGGNSGRYSSLWREINSGSTDNNNKPTWKIAKSGAMDNQDIPNLLGGSLSVYNNGGNLTGVYFGGKLKTDGITTDYGRTYGPKYLGHPDTIDNNNDNLFTALDSGASSQASGYLTSIASNVSNSNVVKSFTFKSGGESGASCAYLGQTGCEKLLVNHLGNLGRSSHSNGAYGGASWGSSFVVINPGSAFLSKDSQANLILSTPTLWTNALNNWGQQGYQPYKQDTPPGGKSYGTLGADFTSDKTGMFAGYAQLAGGGAVLVTASSIGTAIITSGRGINNNYSYSYCPLSDVSKDSNGNYVSDGNRYVCKSDSLNSISWLPDPEDLLFVMNAGVNLAASDSYKVVGYYGGVRRGYIVTYHGTSDPVVQEVVP